MCTLYIFLPVYCFTSRTWIHRRSSAEPMALAVTSTSHPHVMLVLFLKPPPAWQSPLLGRTETGTETQAAAWGCTGYGECRWTSPRGLADGFKDKLRNWLSRVVFCSLLVSIPCPTGGK